VTDTGSDSDTESNDVDSDSGYGIARRHRPSCCCAAARRYLDDQRLVVVARHWPSTHGAVSRDVTAADRTDCSSSRWSSVQQQEAVTVNVGVNTAVISSCQLTQQPTQPVKSTTATTTATTTDHIVSLMSFNYSLSASQYGDGAGNTVEENSSVFSLI